MTIIGITPIDSALAVFGLNLSQRIFNFVFLETPVGVVFFAIGFLLCLLRAIKQKASYSRFFIVFLSVPLLLSVRTSINSFQSAQEIFGRVNQSAQQLKESFLSNNDSPFFLFYLNQGFDVLSIGVIHAIDGLLSEPYRFLKSPLMAQQLSADIKRAIHQQIQDHHLELRLTGFMNDHYWPALAQLDPVSLREHWPGDEQILRIYVKEGRSQWDVLDKDIKKYIQNRTDLNALLQKEVGVLVNKSPDDVGAAIESAVVLAQLEEKNSQSLWMQVVHWILRHYFDFYGVCMAIILAMFPFWVLSMYLWPRVSLAMHYVKFLCWSKSLPLCAALSSYISLMYLQLYKQAQHSISWFWEESTFSVMAGVSLLVTTGASFLIINQMGDRL